MVCGYLDVLYIVGIGWVRVWVVRVVEEVFWFRKEVFIGCRDGGGSLEVKRREIFFF